MQTADKKYDIAIIGAGIVGVSAAYFACQQGADVLLLEKSSIGQGCTHASAGLVAPSGYRHYASRSNIGAGIGSLFDRHSPIRIRPRMDLGWLAWMNRFILAGLSKKQYSRSLNLLLEINAQSKKLHGSLSRAGGCDYVFAGNGRLNVYLNPKSFEAGIAIADDAGTHGIPSAIIRAGQIRAFEPWLTRDVAGGVFYPDDAHVLPGAFARWLASEAARHGAHIRTNTLVSGFRHSGCRVSAVLTSGAEFRADNVIIAAGAWSEELARMLGQRLPVKGAKGYSLTIPGPKEMPQRPLLLEDDHIAIVPYPDCLRLTSSWELCGTDESINMASIDRTIAATRKYTDRLEPVRVSGIRMGLRPTSPDGLPIMGRLHPGSNAWVAGGHGQEGITQGPLTGQQIAATICGAPLGVLEIAQSPQRFFQSF